MDLDNLMDKYYSSIESWKIHAQLVKDISQEIINCFEQNNTDFVISNVDKAAIELSCAFHDVGRDEGKKDHEKRGKKIFKEEIWTDILETKLLNQFSDEEMKNIRHSAKHAILSHRDRDEVCSLDKSLIVGVCVYASDKIAHICQDRTYETYWDVSIKFHKLFEELRTLHKNTPEFDMLFFSIVQIMSDKYPH